MAIGGCEVSCCFLTTAISSHSQTPSMAMLFNDSKEVESTPILPDLSDPEEARKAFIMSEIFNRKY